LPVVHCAFGDIDGKVLISSSLLAQICEGNTRAANTDIATVVSGTATTATFVRGQLPFHEARAALYTRPARLRVNSIVFFIGVLSTPVSLLDLKLSIAWHIRWKILVRAEGRFMGG
jgi:hypothetical protein